MEIFFHDPEDTPRPPEEVRIRTFEAHPYPDGRRVRVVLELTPFQSRPNADLRIANSQGETVASVSVIETIDPKMELTLHLRERQPGGAYTVQGVVYYHPPEQGGEPGSEAVGDLTDLKAEREIVDQATTAFELP